MTEFLRKSAATLFGSHLEFRVRLFNIMAAGGTLISLVMAASGLFTNAKPNTVAVCTAIALLSAALLWYSERSGRYRLCYVISIIAIFLIFFPALFFGSGGYHGGMPTFFVLAVLLTVLMLKGKMGIAMSAAELVLYTGLCIYAYRNPQHINFFQTEAALLMDTAVSFITVSAALGVTLALHFNLYDRRQEELEAARRQLEEHSKMKSELFAAMSHEMRTPLTVMSAYAQFAVEQIREEGPSDQTLASLATISGEARRLAEMADGTMKMLLSTLGNGAAEELPAPEVDIGDLAARLCRLLKPVAERKGRKLAARISAAKIRGNPDALSQLLWNILQNAVTHSDGNIELAVKPHGGGALVTVSDNGEGIDPDILPRIFERGVAGKKGGSGIGLALCREIATLHDGNITVQSEPGAGTTVTVTLNGIKKEGVNG